MSGTSRIHPTAIVAADVNLGHGCVVGPFVVLGEGAPDDGGPVQTLDIGDGGLIRSHTVIYLGTRIGAEFQTGHGVLIRDATSIGDRASIGSHSVVEHHVRIGAGVRLHSNVFVPEFTVLEDDSWIGPNVVMTNAKYPRGAHAKANLVGPHVERGAKVGANVTILPGVTVGEQALIGAGSVVTKDVAPGSVVVGVPAKPVGRVSDIDDYRVLLRPEWSEPR